MAGLGGSYGRNLEGLANCSSLCSFVHGPHRKNKKEEKIVQAFLSSLDIDYHSEAQEDKALYKAMSEGRKTRKLTAQERARFLKILGSE